MPSFCINSNPASTFAFACSIVPLIAPKDLSIVSLPNISLPAAPKLCHQAIAKGSHSCIVFPRTILLAS